jgi:hypothetical protein
VSFFMTSDIYVPLDRPNSHFLQTAIKAMLYVRKRVHQMLDDGTGLEHANFRAPDGDVKDMLVVDKVAENECARFLTKAYGESNIGVLGEETLWRLKALNLRTSRVDGYGSRAIVIGRPETRPTFLLDMIDGSDLIERGLGNWCSALIFMKPGIHPQILFSLVQNEDGTIYGADEMGAFVIPAGNPRGGLLPVRGPDTVLLSKPANDKPKREEIAQIAICYYGQKVGHFATIPPELFAWANASECKKRLRFYNLAGNPMMARLANGESVHAVFEHIGQLPHDAAPGAYIALKAGAHLLNLSGVKIGADDLATSLMTPSGAQMQYVLASTLELADELAQALGSRRVFYACPTEKCDRTRIVLASETAPICDECGVQMRARERRGTRARGLRVVGR